MTTFGDDRAATRWARTYAERLDLELRLRNKQPDIYLGAMTIEQLRAMVDDDGAVDKQAMRAVEGVQHGA
jgi:hypothetical protein